MSSDSCPVNIGPKGRRRRATFSIAMHVLAVAAMAALFLSGATWPWYLVLLPLLFLAQLGSGQARAHT